MEEQSNNTFRMPNRSARRKAMKIQGFFKQKKNLSLSDKAKLSKEIRVNGSEIHNANVERNEKAAFMKLEEIESKKISRWREEGYNDKEIAQLREADSLIMIKNKATWQADKKSAKDIIKKVSESLKARS
tara:strand:+ start:1039 stop:1428 length:390 start_codon:yes stop_codon:yes gene_type:complete